MPRPRTPIGTFGEISISRDSGRFQARTRFRAMATMPPRERDDIDYALFLRIAEVLRRFEELLGRIAELDT